MANQPPTGDFESAGMVRVESPFPVFALPRVWSWMEGFRDRVADDYGPKTLEEFVEDWRSEVHRKTWGVWRGPELGGLIIWQPWPVGGIGETHAVFKKSFWGRATTRTALALVYAELFGSGVRKVMGFPFERNHATLALARSIGFHREGTLRQQTLKNGQPVDVAVLGLLKDDFAALIEKEKQTCHPSPSQPPSSEAASPAESPATAKKR